MKSVLGLVVAMMLVAPGCGDDTTSATTNDMSVTVADMVTVTPKPDMVATKATTCAQAYNCVVPACFTGAGASDPIGCATTCASALTGAEQAKWNTLLTCVEGAAAVPNGDGGFTINLINAGKSITPPGGVCVSAADTCNGIGLDH
jgi:hypothetical protein